MGQFGSYKEDAKYESETNTFVLAINYLPTEKWNLFFTGTYTNSEVEMEQMRDYSGVLDPKMAGAGYDYDLSTVHEYSDLEIQQIDLSVGVDYQITNNLSAGCGFTYLKYDDDAPYVYGDDTGSAYITNLSVSYLF